MRSLQLRRRHRIVFAVVLCASLVTVTASPASAAMVPSGFTETPIATGLELPTTFAMAPDGRVFVSEKPGRLRVIENGTLLPTPFVDLTGKISDRGERGLLGIAFDPQFRRNHYVYVYYTAAEPYAHNRVSRFVADGNVAVPDSEDVIIDLPVLERFIHNGGAIHFGPDGKLYIAVGENAVGTRAQSMNDLLGKMLRLNRNGTIPRTNPFYHQATGENRAIWALGLRNPYSFAFKPGTSTMYINDVGLDLWEEINLGVAGGNYGWPVTEGPTTDPAYISPLYAYGHGISETTGCAIVGAAFYNPKTMQFPLRFAGDYFYADFCSGWIRRYDPDSDTTIRFIQGIVQPVDLLVSPDGDLYYLARGSSRRTGQVVKVSYVGT